MKQREPAKRDLRTIPDTGKGPLIPARKVQDRYQVTDRTIDRWVSDEQLGFPKPLVINRRRYFYESELEAWERNRVAQQRTAA
jgi:predicted DNA-binding transcriptional regulator AlpA